MKVSEINPNELNNDLVDKILYEGIDDQGLKGDCILVLGSVSADKYRVPKAIEIYHSKRSNKLLMSGGRYLEQYGTSEALMMKNCAIRELVHEEDIILETTSKTTKENIICSLLSLERAFKISNVKKLLLVTTRYHMRRSLLMAETYLPSWIEIIPCPADDTNTLRHNWFQNERGYKRAYDEARKVISYIKEGSINDFEI